MADEQVIATWQRKLDRDFPDGAVCTWERPGSRPVIYMVPKIEVTGAAGLDPLVQMTPLDMSRVLGPLRLTSYHPAAGWPPGTARVTFDNEADAMYWNPRVPPVMARMSEAEPDQGQQ